MAAALLILLWATPRIFAQEPRPWATDPTASLPGPPSPRSEAVAGLGPFGVPGRGGSNGLGTVLAMPFPLPGRSRGFDADGPVGPERPPGGGRPRPGSPFNPGAAGPGIGRGRGEHFLDGALDPATGWPFVILDHFKPIPDRVEGLFIVSTRECPQVLGSDPWPCIKVRRFDAEGTLVECPASELFARTVGRPVLIQVQGNRVRPDMALGGLLWTHTWLQANRCMPPDAVAVAFDWPSERIFRGDYRDVNEKSRRADVAAHHLARFVQGFPPSSRACLLGQSYGGRVVSGALHLLGGGTIEGRPREPSARLPTTRPDIHLHAVVIAAATDRDSLNPDRRFDRALVSASAFLNLYNRRDEALLLHPALLRTDHRRALGRVGLSPRDFVRLGPAAARYEEHDIDEVLGREHSLLDAVASPVIGRRIAPYLWAPDPGPLPEPTPTPPVPRPGRSRRPGS